MSEKNRAVVVMQFQDGTQFFTWTQFSLRSSYTDPLGDFQFEVRPLRNQVAEQRAQLKKGRLIGVLIGDNPQGAFLITDVRTKDSPSDGIVISVSCKTVLATAYEGHVDPEISESFSSDTAVSEVVLLALEPYGFAEVFGDAKTNLQALTGKSISGAAPNVQVEALKLKDAKASEGDTAYGFCSRIFARLGIVLHVDFEGALLLSVPDYSQEASYAVARGVPGTEDLMIGDVEEMASNSGQFSEWVVRGQSDDKAGQKSSAQPKARAKIAGLEVPDPVPFSDAPTVDIPAGRHTYDSEGGAVYKPFYRIDKHSRDGDYCNTMCHRIHGRQAESAYVISCTVDGLMSNNGAIWTPNTVVRVRIDSLEIDEDMWILETTKTVKDDAQKTQLRIIPLNSLILAAA